MNKTKSILLIKLSAIGDVVHTLPLLEVLRRNFPETRIDWLIENEAGDIIAGHDAVDHIIISDRKSWHKRLFKAGEVPKIIREISRFIKELRGERYDIVIDLQGLLKSGVLTGLARGRRKIGFTGGREGSGLFLTEPPYPVDYERHAVDRYLKTAEYLGCRMDTWEGKIPLRASDKESADRFIRENKLQDKCLVALNPMARWKTKLWEDERFADLADRIRKDLSCEVIFTGSRHDRPVIDRIIGSMEGRAYNLAGRTSLKELADLYSRCRLTVTTDTGPMHIAAAMGCPVVALFGPTAPWRTGPYGNGHRVIRTGIECSPCFKKKCAHKTCMKDISVRHVFEAAAELLQKDSPPGEVESVG